MKKIFTALGLIFFVFSIMIAQAQDLGLTTLNTDKATETKLKTFIEQYNNHITTSDIDNILDITHPGLYKIANKNLIKTQLKEALHNDYFKMTFTEINYIGTDEAYEYNNVNYYFIKYMSAIQMDFTKSEEQSEEDFKSYMDYVMELYSIQFQEDKVTRHGNSIKIRGPKKLLIIDDPKIGDLKMIEIKLGMNEIYKKFLPKDIVNALGNS